MAEYTDKTKLLERLTDYYNCAAMDYTKPLSVCAAADCLSIVEESPTADVVKVVYGEWKFNKDGSGTCNQCGITQKNVWNYDSWQNYCGHCGADMRGIEKRSTDV